MPRRPWSLYTKEQVVEAIRSSFGIISKIALNLHGCDWHTAKKYVGHWEETRAAYADEAERSLDLSESKLLQAVNAGDGPMIRFHLATKGKDRGFTERREITGANAGPIETKDVSELSTREAVQRLVALAEHFGTKELDAGTAEEHHLSGQVSE